MTSGTSVRRRRGANAVEFSLVVPVLVLLTFFIIDWGWYMVAYQEVQHATRHAAIVGSQTAFEDYPESKALQDLQESTLEGVVLPRLLLEAQADVIDELAIEVRVIAQFEPLLGLVPTPGSITAGSRMELEPL